MSIFERDPQDPDDKTWLEFFWDRVKTNFDTAIGYGPDKRGLAANAIGAATDGKVALLEHYFSGPASEVAVKYYGRYMALFSGGIAFALSNREFGDGVGVVAQTAADLIIGTAIKELTLSIIASSEAALGAEGAAASALLLAPEIAGLLGGIAVGIVAGVAAQSAYEGSAEYAAQQANDSDDDSPKPKPTPHPSTPPTKSDPIVLDLAGNGINLTALTVSSAHFDYVGSGVPIATGWVGEGNGLLVLAPANGETVTAANLLGAYSGNGFADLAALDANGDGIINAEDPAYAQLRVWVNASGTGQSSAGELFGLDQLGITAINVNALTSGAINNGNTIVATSTFVVTNRATGVVSTNTIADVNFATNLQITQLPSISVNPSQVALNLPNLAGFGFLPDLNIAVTTDAVLEKMVYNLVFNSAAMTSTQFNAAFQAMLYEWAGATNVGPTAYGNYIDGQHLAVTYAYLGINPATNPQYAGWEPNGRVGPVIWEPTYQQILQFYELAFMSQILQSQLNFGVDTATALSNPYAAFSLLAYDKPTNTFLGGASNLSDILAAQAPTDPAAAVTYWAQVQGAIQLYNYTQGAFAGDDYIAGDAGLDGRILKLIAPSTTREQALNIVNAINQVAHTFTITKGASYTNITGDSASVTYAGIGTVEVPATYSGYVVVPAGCTQLTLYGGGWSIVLEDANALSDVSFSAQGSSLIATFTDGSTLDLVNQLGSLSPSARPDIFLLNGGTAIPLTEIANQLIAEQAAAGSKVINGFAVGGTLEGAAGNDVLIATSAPYNASLSNVDEPGVGTTNFDIGTGNNVLITSFGSRLDSLGNLIDTQNVRDIVNYNSGDGNELVYTVNNQNFDSRYAYGSSLGYYIEELVDSKTRYSDLYTGFSYSSSNYQLSQNFINFGAGISAQDVQISAAGALYTNITDPFNSDPTTSYYGQYYYVDGGSINPWSLVVTVDGAKTITFTGGPNTLQGITFADGSVLTAQQISDAYVASEAAHNLSFIQGTSLGTTLQGTVGSQVLVGYGGNDTIIAGAGQDTLLAGYGVNTYEFNSQSGNAVIINNRSSDDEVLPSAGQAYPTYVVGSGATALDDSLVFGAGIDPSQVTATVVASLSGDGTLSDILLTIAGTGQTVRLVDQYQSLASFNPTIYGNNGAAVGQVRFADGTVWSAADLLSMLTDGATAVETAAYPGFTIVNGTSGNDNLSSNSTHQLLAGGLGSDNYFVSLGDASVVIDPGLNGAGGGTLDQRDLNLLKLGAGISASDVTVTQGTNGRDIILTIGATGQTITLANQLTAQSDLLVADNHGVNQYGPLISQVQFADGTVWTNEQLFLASEAGSLSAGATTLYGSASAGEPVGLSNAATDLRLVSRGYREYVQFGTGNDTAIVDTTYAEITLPSANTNDVIDFTGAAVGSFSGRLTTATIPTSAQWSADGRNVILSFGGAGQTVTLKNFTGESSLTIFNPALSYTLFGFLEKGSEALFSSDPTFPSLFPSLLNVTAAAGQTVINVAHDDVTVDAAGNAQAIDATGSGDTFIYKSGYGAVTIDVTADAANPSGNIVTLSGVSVDDQPGSTNYSINAAGDLTLNFGGGDVLTILHEYNADGTISANGIQHVGAYQDQTLANLALESRTFTAAAGQPNLSGDGQGGIFDPQGIASTISDTGSVRDTIIYSAGYGALTIESVSSNSGNVIEFGAGITLSSLSFAANGNGDLIISAGGSDKITIVNGLGLVEPTSGPVSYITNLTFVDGSSASISIPYVFGSDGSVADVDLTAAANLTLTGGAGVEIFNPDGIAHSIVGGGGADQVNYNAGDGPLTIDETSVSGTTSAVLSITDYNLYLGSYGGGYGGYGGYGGGYGSSTGPDLGSIVGVTEDGNGDVTLYLGNGDNITLLGQLSTTPGAARGVGTIVLQAVGDTYYDGFAEWTNADLEAALAYEATTGVVPNDPDAVVISGDGVATAPVVEQAGVVGSVASDTATGIVDFADASAAPPDAVVLRSVTASGATTGAPAIASLLSMLSFGTVTQPQNVTDGSVSWTFDAPAGTFAYLSAGEVLTLAYDFAIDNGAGGSGNGSVTVTITGTNQSPVIQGSVTTATGSVVDQATGSNAAGLLSASGAIAFTDANFDDSHSASVVSVIASGATSDLPSNASLLSLLSLGDVSEQPSASPGSLAWSFAAPIGAFAWLATGQTTTLTYTVEIADGHGGIATQNVVVTITGANDVPVIDPTGTSASSTSADTQDAPITASGAIAFTDAHALDTHSATIAGVSATGTTSGLPASAALLSLLSLGNLTDQNGSTPGTVAWNFAGSGSAFAYLSAGEAVTLNYVVEIANSEGGIAVQNVAITVTGTNAAPLVVPSATTATAGYTEYSGSSDSVRTVTGSIAFGDANINDTHVASITDVAAAGDISGLPSTTTLLSLLSLGTVGEGTATGPGSVGWTFAAPNNAFTWLGLGDTVTLNYTVQVADNNGGIVAQDIAITITGTYDLPVIAPAATTADAAFAAQGTSGPPNATDSASGAIAFTDANAATSHSASVVSVSPTGTYAITAPGDFGFASGVFPDLPSNAALLSMLTIDTPTAPGTSTPGQVNWHFTAPDHEFDYLSQDESVTLNYVVEIANGLGGQATQLITVTVTGTNDAPVIVGQTSGTVHEQVAPAPNSALNSVQQDIVFTDPNFDDTHGASVIGVSATGDVAGIPSEADLLSMISLGTPSEAYGRGADTVGWAFTATNGAFAYLGQGESVTLTYAVQITDNHGGVATQNVIVTVVGANDVPVIAPDSTTATGVFTDQSDPASATVVATLSGNVGFTDAYQADTHSATVINVRAYGDTSGLPGYATLASLLSLGDISEQADGNPGSVAWTFAAPNGDFASVGLGETLTLDYTIQIANNTGGSTTQDVTITVTGTRDKPVIVSSATTATAAITDLAASSAAAFVQTASGLVAFTDPDSTLAHSASVVGVSAGGTVTDLPSNATLLSLLTLGEVAEEAGATPGSIAWNFALRNGDFAWLDQGQTLSLRYTIQLSNSSGGTTQQDIVISIAGTNDVPQIIGSSTIAYASVPELLDVPDSALDTASGSISFSDASLATSHTAKVVSVYGNPALLPLLTLGSVTEASGSAPGSVAWNFAIPNGDYSWLPQGQTATLTYVIQITNNLGEAVNQDVSITIIGAKDIPAIYRALTTATGSVAERPAPATDTTLDTASGTIAFADTHLEFTHSAAVIAASADGAVDFVLPLDELQSWFTLGSVSELPNSTSGSVGWSFAIPNGTFDYLGAGQTVTLNYIVRIANGTGGTVDQTVSVTVTGTEFAPVIVQSGTTATGAITEGASGATSTSASGVIAFADTNRHDAHTAGISGVTATGSIAGLPSTATLLSLLALSGVTEASGDTSGSLSWTFADPAGDFGYLAAGQTVTLTYVIQISDNHGGTVSQNVVVNVSSGGGTEVRYASSGTFAGVSYSSYGNSYTADGRRYLQTFYDAAGNAVASETFTPEGGYTITVGRVVQQVATVNADGSYDIHYYSSGSFAAASYASYDNAWNSANFRNLETFYDAAGNVVASEAFTPNGGYTITVGGVVQQVATVNADGSYDIHYYTGGSFAGTNYASYANGWNSTNFRNLETFYDAAGNVVASEAFTPNGGYTITVGGVIEQVATVNADGSYDIRYDSGGSFAGTNYASYDNAWNSANFRDLETFYDAAGNVVASEAFAQNGGYTITVDGVIEQVATVNVDGSYDIRYHTGGSFAGVNYNSYDNAWNSTNFRNLETFYDAAGNVVASEAFTPNGGYTITVGGVVQQVATVNADGSYDIRYYTGGSFAGASYASYDNAWNSANFRNLETFYDAAGNVVASEAFTPNGGYTITVGGVVQQVAAVNADGSYQLSYENVAGRPYTAITYSYASSGAVVGTAEHLVDGSITSRLSAAGLSFDDTNGVQTINDGSDVFELGSGFGGSVDIGNAAGVSLGFGTGDGAFTVSGFFTDGAGADTIVFGKDVFADWAHLLGATQQQGSDLLITLDPTDTVLLKNVSLASFTSANARFV